MHLEKWCVFVTRISVGSWEGHLSPPKVRPATFTHGMVSSDARILPVTAKRPSVWTSLIFPNGKQGMRSGLQHCTCVMFACVAQNSARIIRASVFGVDETKKIREKFMFPQNNLVVTSIDIQSVEPVDQRTRDSLQKSVQLAIEITTNSQEAAARFVCVQE